MSVGNTRLEVPTKVSIPRPCIHSRNASGEKSAQQRLDLIATCAVAGEEDIERLGMRDVHASFACHEEFASHAGHGVIDVHLHAALRQHFCGHQSGRAAAYDGDDMFSYRGAGCHDGEGVIKAGDYRALPLLRPVSIQERIMAETKPE